MGEGLADRLRTRADGLRAAGCEGETGGLLRLAAEAVTRLEVAVARLESERGDAIASLDSMTACRDDVLRRCSQFADEAKRLRVERDAAMLRARPRVTGLVKDQEGVWHAFEDDDEMRAFLDDRERWRRMEWTDRVEWHPRPASPPPAGAAAEDIASVEGVIDARGNPAAQRAWARLRAAIEGVAPPPAGAARGDERERLGRIAFAADMAGTADVPPWEEFDGATREAYCRAAEAVANAVRATPAPPEPAATVAALARLVVDTLGGYADTAARRAIGDRYGELLRTTGLPHVEAGRRARVEWVERLLRARACPECGGCKYCLGARTLRRFDPSKGLGDAIPCPRCKGEANAKEEESDAEN